MASTAALGRATVVLDLEGNAEAGLQRVGDRLAHLPQDAAQARRATSAVAGGLSQIREAGGGLSGMFGNLFGGATAGAQGLMSNALTPMAGMFTSLLGGMGVNELVDINNQYENTQRTMAGTLRALGLGGASFEESMGMSARLMAQIDQQAAALPGEAEDYIEVFKSTIPQLRGAVDYLQVGTSGATDEMGRMLDFSNTFTATMSSLGIGAQESAMALTRGLADSHGAMEQTGRVWMTMAPFIRQAAQDMDETATSASEFNNLSLETRTRILQSAMASGGLAEMVASAGQSWDAQIGTLESLTKKILRLGSTDIFHGLTTALSRVNGMLGNADGSLTDVGKNLSMMTTVMAGMAVAAGVLSLAMSPVALTIGAVGAAVYIVVDAVRQLEEGWDSIVAEEGPSQFAMMIWPLWTALKGLWEIWTNFNSDTGEGILSERTAAQLENAGMLDFVVNLSGGMWDLWQTLKEIGSYVIGGFQSAWGWLTNAWAYLGPKVTRLMTAFDDGGASMDVFFSGVGPLLEDFIDGLAEFADFALIAVGAVLDLMAAFDDSTPMSRVNEGVHDGVSALRALKTALDIVLIPFRLLMGAFDFGAYTAAHLMYTYEGIALSINKARLAMLEFTGTGSQAQLTQLRADIASGTNSRQEMRTNGDLEMGGFRRRMVREADQAEAVQGMMGANGTPDAAVIGNILATALRATQASKSAQAPTIVKLEVDGQTLAEVNTEHGQRQTERGGSAL